MAGLHVIFLSLSPPFSLSRRALVRLCVCWKRALVRELLMVTDAPRGSGLGSCSRVRTQQPATGARVRSLASSPSLQVVPPRGYTISTSPTWRPSRVCEASCKLFLLRCWLCVSHTTPGERDWGGMGSEAPEHPAEAVGCHLLLEPDAGTTVCSSQAACSARVT